jgi:hypothetical protein
MKSQMREFDQILKESDIFFKAMYFPKLLGFSFFEQVAVTTAQRRKGYLLAKLREKKVGKEWEWKIKGKSVLDFKSRFPPFPQYFKTTNLL